MTKLVTLMMVGLMSAPIMTHAATVAVYEESPYTGFPSGARAFEESQVPLGVPLKESAQPKIADQDETSKAMVPYKGSGTQGQKELLEDGDTDLLSKAIVFTKTVIEYAEQLIKVVTYAQGVVKAGQEFAASPVGASIIYVGSWIAGKVIGYFSSPSDATK